MLFENNGERVNQSGSLHHRVMMSKIDKHFLDTSSKRTIDADLASYVTTVDVNGMQQFDRTRINLVKIEVERIQIHARRERLHRYREAQNKQASCPICLEVFKPAMAIVYPICGHVVCHPCMNKVIATRGLDNACACCRQSIDNPDGENLQSIQFMFNHDSDAICRFCEHPFEADAIESHGCKVLSCSHAFHANCLSFNQNKCTTCLGFMSAPPKSVYLQFNWVFAQRQSILLCIFSSHHFQINIKIFFQNNKKKPNWMFEQRQLALLWIFFFI